MFKGNAIFQWDRQDKFCRILEATHKFSGVSDRQHSRKTIEASGMVVYYILYRADSLCQNMAGTGYLTSNWNFHMGYCEDMVNASTLGS